MKLYVDYAYDLNKIKDDLVKVIAFTSEQKMHETHGLLTAALLPITFCLEDTVRTKENAELAAIEDGYADIWDTNTWGTVPF